MENGNKPAYPTEIAMYDDGIFIDPQIANNQWKSSGLTKREVFVIAAMQGLSSCPIPGNHNSPDQIAEMAVQIADETLKQLSK